MPEETRTPAKLPTVAIVGRPNVGKSSLFNAILGRRFAIVHEMSGVTRDRVASTVIRGERKFNLIDTGGLGTIDGSQRGGDRWDAPIAAQVEAAVAEADVLIMVADAQAGITPLDLDVAAQLRHAGRKVFFAANKCDSDELKNHAVEFSALGFGEVFTICCKHRGGVNALIDAAIAGFPRNHRGPEEKKPVGIAVVGRPNVGKSSLVNALLGEERMVIADVAGTTRDAVDVEFSLPDLEGGNRSAVLVDTAGLRKKTKVDNVVELFSVMRAQSAVERADIVVLVLEADPDGVTAQDRKIGSLIRKAGKGCVIAINKCDRLSGVRRAELAETFRRTLPGLGYAPVCFISALRKEGLEELRREVAGVAAALESEISTGALNRVLAEAFETRTPPVVSSVPLKLFYATMVGKRPPRIRLFVNRPEAAADHYLIFLQKRLWSAFKLSGVPVELELAARPKKVESIKLHVNPAKRKDSKRK